MVPKSRLRSRWPGVRVYRKRTHRVEPGIHPGEEGNEEENATPPDSCSPEETFHFLHARERVLIPNFEGLCRILG